MECGAASSDQKISVQLDLILGYVFTTKETEEALGGLMYGIETRKGFRYVDLVGESLHAQSSLTDFRSLTWCSVRAIELDNSFRSFFCSGWKHSPVERAGQRNGWRSGE
jgi:hypothetical protein